MDKRVTARVSWRTSYRQRIRDSTSRETRRDDKGSDSVRKLEMPEDPSTRPRMRHFRKLIEFLDAILDGTEAYRVVFPVHPRTRKSLQNVNFDNRRLLPIDPLGYLEFIFLLKYARAVVTDSGGITEEATVLNVPCLTLRDSTERPETVTIGTNELVGTDPKDLAPYFKRLSQGQWKKGITPELWDGRTSERIVEILRQIYGAKKVGGAPNASNQI